MQNRIPPPPPPRVGVPLVAGARLPLAFIALGLLWLAPGVLAPALTPDLLLLPSFHPHVVALVHLWLPGALLAICVGAVYQLMPVVLGVPLRLPLPAAWTHLALHVVGVPALVGGFFTGHYGWVGLGGTLVTVGLTLLASAMLGTFRASARRDAAAWCFPAAGTWLILTVTLGVGLAFNRRHTFLPLSVLDLLRAHAHLGLAGFFLSLLQGVTFQLVPMFTMGTAARPRLIAAGLAGTQLGLLLLAPGLAWHLAPLELAGTVVLLAGLTASGVALHATLRTRRRRVLEPGLRAFVIGAVLLGLAALIGAGRLLTPGPAAGGAVAWLYGLTLVGGGLSLTVLGILGKIVPFLVWMKAYGPWVGQRPVPSATTLASPRLERLWLRLHLLALAVLAGGIVAQESSVVRLGGVLLSSAVALLLLNFLRVARHLRPADAPLTSLVAPPDPATR